MRITCSLSSLLSRFERAGLNVNNSQFGSWWAAQDHLRNARGLQRPMARLFQSESRCIARSDSKVWSTTRLDLWTEDSILNDITMRTLADFDHLYLLKDPFQNRFLRGSVRLPSEANPNGLLTGDWRPAAPVSVGQAEHGIPADVVWTGEPAVVLISERLAQVFRAEHFSGWLGYPVEVNAEATPLKYVGLTVSGRCGPLDNTRGEWVRKDDEPGRFLRGLFFDERSWDGSDFFLPTGTLYKFVTERVRSCLRREGVKNIRCDRLSDVLTAHIVIRNTPGGRARQ